MEKPQKPKILIVDDTPQNIAILAEGLGQDYKIAVATTGIDAIRIVGSDHPPDLILLDIMMPQIDGYEVCRRIKALEKSRNIPIIFITAKVDEEDETMGLGLGAVDYITKPFSIPIVKARVKTHLELKMNRDMLENIARLDGLTGLYNRRYFENAMGGEWRRCLRRNIPLSLIILDIDFFKKFNDQYGHSAGDYCLKEVAGVLKRAARRPGDFAARYGGEEFVLVFPETSSQDAFNIANDVRQNIVNLEVAHVHNPPGIVTASFGLASITPKPELKYDLLVDTADKQLYRAKQAGRNQVFATDLG